MINRFLFSFLFVLPSLSFAATDSFRQVVQCNAHLLSSLDADRANVIAQAGRLHRQYAALADTAGVRFFKVALGSTQDELNQRLTRYAEQALNQGANGPRMIDLHDAIENLERALYESISTEQKKLVSAVPYEDPFIDHPQQQVVPSAMVQPQNMQQLQQVDPHRFGNPYRRDPPREKY